MGKRIPKIKVCHKNEEFNVLTAMMEQLNKQKVQVNVTHDDSTSGRNIQESRNGHYAVTSLHTASINDSTKHEDTSQIKPIDMSELKNQKGLDTEAALISLRSNPVGDAKETNFATFDKSIDQVESDDQQNLAIV